MYVCMYNVLRYHARPTFCGDEGTKETHTPNLNVQLARASSSLDEYTMIYFTCTMLYLFVRCGVRRALLG